MKIKLATIFAMAVMLLGVGGVVSLVKANESSGWKMPFVDALAERFNLDAGEVESFFNERQQERQQEMTNQYQEGLQEAVDNGVITDDQKQMLLDHQAQMQQERETRRQERETWMEESGIDFDALHEYVGFGGGFGGKMGGGHGMGMHKRPF